MKKHIWADPTKEWEGFRPTAYTPSWEKLDVMPLTLESGQLPPEYHRTVIRDPKTAEFAVAEEPATEEHEGNATKERRLTVGGVYRRLARCKFEVEERPIILHVKVKTENGEAVLKGPPFNCAMLRELLALKADGIEPFSSAWFWYDSDSCMDDPHENYSFFVVYGDKIVREQISFSDYSESGFDPGVFDSGNESNPIWRNEKGWCDARTKFWYRKFYTETRTGQLMMLRSDEPTFYHFERIEPRDVDRDLQLVTEVKTYKLLWLAFPLLVALVFPSLKGYMAIAAAALGANFLVFCWTTRKIGRP